MGQCQSHRKRLLADWLYIYKSPNTDRENMEELYKLINSTSSMSNEFSYLLIMGDFNLPRKVNSLLNA